MSDIRFNCSRLMATHLLPAVSVLVLAALSCHARAGSVVEERVEETYPLSADATVSIRNADGRIHVYGSNKNELTIVAVKRAFTKERVAAIKIDARVDATSAVIDTIYPPAPEGRFEDRSGTVDYMIYVPQACTLTKAELTNGEILLQDLRGPSASSSLGMGRSHVRNCFMDLSVTVGSGGLDVFYTWWESGVFSFDAEIANGNVRLALPPNVAARIDLASTFGNIRDRFSKEPAKGEQRAVNATLGDESSIALKVRATRGNITVEKAY